MWVQDHISTASVRSTRWTQAAPWSKHEASMKQARGKDETRARQERGKGEASTRQARGKHEARTRQ